MKRFYASCCALVLGILLVGPVHAGPQRLGQGFGRLSARQGRALRLRHPRWQWLPQQDVVDPGVEVVDPGVEVVDNGVEVVDNGGVDVVRPGVAPKGNSQGRQRAVPQKAGNQRRLPKVGNRSPRVAGSRSPRR
jgi:hypothetical protein